MDEPNPTPNESLGEEKVGPNLLKPARWFGAKIMPPRMPHGMSECWDQPLGPP